MVKRKGMFVAIEHIDGGGGTLQKRKLYEYISGLNSELDITTTFEPWKSKKIRERLTDTNRSYLDNSEMAELYADDRLNHQTELIIPFLDLGGIVISDRFSMSQFAFQGAQGLTYEQIKQMHNERGIIRPNLTFFLDTDFKIARKRLKKKKRDLDNFEKNSKLQIIATEKYRWLAQEHKHETGPFGRVITINGNLKPDKIAKQIAEKFNEFYTRWINGNLEDYTHNFAPTEFK